MPQQDNCIFCKIARGEIPSIKVYEDEHTFAFMDISPATRGHTLVIHKDHHADLFSIDTQALTEVTLSSQRIAQAIMQALKPDGMRIAQFNGEAAGQTVFHYHVHLRPAYQGQRDRSHGDRAGDQQQLEQLAEQIRAQF